ncbi:P-loop NTPase [Roseomonas mucosa]|uniref:P-loop NTPase n=1 Tax=Roseomonas mucosa TaxID=207340 RepID=UPI00384E0F63
MSSVKALKEPDLEVPVGFRQSLQNKRVVMFLGAGASMEARGPSGNKPPSADGLREILAKEFFGQKMDGYDLMSVADMAISTHGQGIVFEKIRAVLEPFKPSAAHKLLPRFHWQQLVTTNYDLLIEQAYAEATQRVQNVVPFVKNIEPVEERKRNTDRPVSLLKLHGCLSHLHDEAVPLILSHEHYALHDRHRYRLFDRVKDLAHESTIVFCGYRLGDSHIRKIVHELQKEGVRRPMWYMITPTAIDAEIAYWAGQNVQVIRGTFGQFMAALDRSVPEMWRALEPGAGLVDLPIQRHFRTRSDPSLPLRTALGRDLRYIHAGMPVAQQDAGKFYEGYDTGWGAVVHGLDIQRRIVDDLLLEAISDEDGSAPVRLHLLRGPAGSGKSVALKRAAWNAATQLEQLVLWLEDGGLLGSDILAELHDLTGKRIVLFVDRAAERWTAIADLLAYAQRKGMLLSVIAAERDNEWNVYGHKIGDGVAPSELRIGQLSTPEIEKLIGLLKVHGALGILQDASFEEQVEAFSNKADRQLLVALHEATRGLPFQEIIFDEYESVVPERARRLYLDICTLHQFGAPVRAGTISRATGVRFNYFQEELLAPLENVVLVEEDTYSGDMAYRSRHAKVAEMVFQQACPDDSAKVERLTRLVEQLDVGYSVDRHTMEQVAKGRTLGAMIQTAALGREVYQAILKAEPDQAYVYQQWAIYEMQVPDGSYDEADRLSALAVKLNPRNRSIAHTYSEVARRRAKEESSPLRRDRCRQQARTRLAEAGSSNDKMVLSTRCKLLVDEVTDLVKAVKEGGDDTYAAELAEKVRDAQSAIRQFQRLHGDDADTLQTEAQLHSAVDQEKQAVTALERAWNATPRGSSVALRLARAYVGQGNRGRADAILRDALSRDPDDKIVHFELARMALDAGEETGKAFHHLTRSYTRGDANHDARHLHAQLLFMNGLGTDAAKLFREVDQAAPATYRSGNSVSPTSISRRLPRFKGRIVRKEATYALVTVPNYPSHLLAPQKHTAEHEWTRFGSASEVEFAVGFGRRGPVALDVKLINQL